MDRTQASNYAAIAKIRNRQFKEEQLGSLGTFYRDTAAGYQKKLQESAKEMQKWKDIWDNRFARAEEQYLSAYRDAVYKDKFQNKNIELRKQQAMTGSNDPLMAEWDAFQAAKTVEDMERLYGTKYRPNVANTGMLAYAKDSAYNQGQTVVLGRILDATGKRKSYEDIIKGDTSARGNRFLLAQEADQMMRNQFDYDDINQTYTSYQSRFDAEQAALAKRNEEARARFLEEKNQALMAAEASAYRGASYTEKPL